MGARDSETIQLLHFSAHCGTPLVSGTEVTKALFSFGSSLLVLDELQLRRSSTSGFAIVGNRIFGKVGTDTPLGHALGTFTKQTAIVELRDILQLARQPTMRTLGLSVGQIG